MGKLILTAGLCLLMTSMASSYKLVCYYTSWSNYRTGEGKLTPSDVDPFQCTHLIFAFASINYDNELIPGDQRDIESYKTFNGLKDRNPDLKTLLAVGGQTFCKSQFRSMASTKAKRDRFIKSSIQLLRNYGFDGINLDWQFPTNSRRKFTWLCKELLRAFSKEAEETGSPRLLVTSAVSASKGIIDESYEMAKIANYLDFLNVMTYNFHGFWDSVTGHHSPLDQRTADDQLNTAFAMKYWQDQGVPAEKLILGLAAFGRTFTLSTTSSGVGAPISNVGKAGPYTMEAGSLSYYEVCLALEGKQIEWITDQKVPYGVAGDQWIGFDNKESIDAKVKHVKDNNLGGVFVWSLDHDDFNGNFCKEGKYPLVSHLRSILVPGTSADFCKGKNDGNYPIPNDPYSFYQCSNGVSYTQKCQGTLVYNPSCDCCNWPQVGVHP
ncbi:putative acidic mammalian chitinase-like [Scophthalmus maximus]|uniref:Acidic mammalian chitinase n=2 Tax=Scophthalmus maximus TaxID=52904 RepID=A0A2U9C3T4_SCOMX|nr:putative acidic mammalian chitinase-like [Scophthalmus maximus]